MGNIVVQLADCEWTTRALHLASALARNNGSQVILLHLMLAHNPGLLGWDAAVTPPTWAEYDQIQEYGAICEDYGVEFHMQPMQYVTLIGALTDASVILDADVLFAQVPDSRFSFWKSLTAKRLTHALHAVGCTLYLIDEHTSMIDWIPAHRVDMPPVVERLVER
jgi:hypothetical protein